MSRIHRALISVSDSTGLEELARALHALAVRSQQGNVDAVHRGAADRTDRGLFAQLGHCVWTPSGI